MTPKALRDGFLATRLNEQEAKTLAKVLTDAERGASSWGASTSAYQQVDKALEIANVAVRGYGVEAITGNYVNRYFQNIQLLYVNLGDTYNTTIVYDTEKRKFRITSYGDWVEKYGEERGVE